MKQTLPDYIKQNGGLHKVLLAQEGGIMKYLAEHLDANGTAELFSGYQDHCTNIFFEKNKWDLLVVWEGDNVRRAALGQMEHIWKELRYQRALKPFLAEIPAEVAETIELFTEQYLTYAYRQYRLRRFPNGITPRDIYREVIGLYNLNGMAFKSMEIILKEHHAKGDVEKTESEFLTEFMIRQYSEQLTLGVFSQMRQAVAEMLESKCPERCRQMAIDTMKSVRLFSQMIYTDGVVRSLRRSKLKKEAEERKNDGEWLRDVADRTPFKDYSRHIKKHSMHSCFANFVNLLKEVGRIWAAQLLVRDIDMHKLEKEVCCILNPSKDPHYYVDKYYIDDLPDLYCISNIEMAERLLQKLGQKLLKACYLEVADKKMEVAVRTILSKAYIRLKSEGFLNDSTTQLTFINVLMNNDDGKIVWLNDPNYRYLRTLIKIFLGIQNDYPYGAILKINRGSNYSPFVCNHFVDENGEKLKFVSNGHDVGKKERRERFDDILKAIFG